MWGVQCGITTLGTPNPGCINSDWNAEVFYQQIILKQYWQNKCASIQFFLRLLLLLYLFPILFRDWRNRSHLTTNGIQYHTPNSPSLTLTAVKRFKILSSYSQILWSYSQKSIELYVHTLKYSRVLRGTLRWYLPVRWINPWWYHKSSRSSDGS